MVLVLFLLSSVLFLSMIIVTLTIAGFVHLVRHARRGQAEPRLHVPPLPSPVPQLLVQLPIYEEAALCERILTSTARLDWPKERLTIQLLDDSSEETAIANQSFVVALQAEGFDVQHVRRGTRDGYKAGALAHGLSLCDAPYVAVFDADFTPDPSFLRHAIARLEDSPTASFLQGRNSFRATGGLARVQAMAQDVHYLVEQNVRAMRHLPIQFNGTGGVWRRAQLAKAGGWSGDTLAEDLDLALRCQLLGYSGLFMEEPASGGDVPEDRAAFQTQQARWSKGIVQVGRKHLLALWRSGLNFEAKAMCAHWFVMQAAPSAVALMALSAAILAWLASPAFLVPPLILLLAGVLTMGLATRRAHIRYHGSQGYWAVLLQLPFVYLGLALSGFRAISAALWSRSSGVFIRTPKDKN
jgi:cellulose synthase/poly-beta-1,6-N-acetylglucosamine synthase-like glycosyltransferase